MTTNREVIESPIDQGIDEVISYSLTTTPWGSTPSSPAVVVYDITNGTYTDVTTTVMPVNIPTIDGDVITLSPLRGLTANQKYRIEVKFTSGGNVFEPFAFINSAR